MARPINAAGLGLIKSFEGFQSHPYQDEGGIFTIGYGHTHGVTADSPPVTETQAEGTLQSDLAQFGGYVMEFITETLSDNEYAALVSLTENCGTAPLLEGLGKALNAGDRATAADHFLLWDKEHIDGELVVVDGLTRRREAERQLFLTPDDKAAPDGGPEEPDEDSPATHNID